MAGLDEALSTLSMDRRAEPEFGFSQPVKTTEDPPKQAEPTAAAPKQDRKILLTMEHAVLLMTAVALTLALCIYKGHLGSGDRHA